MDYNNSNNVIGIEIPGSYIAEGNLTGSPLSHLESAVRDGLGLRSGEAIEDYVGTVVTGIKTEATYLITDLALRDSEYTSEDYKQARGNDSSLQSDIEDEFLFDIVVDIAPINYHADELKNSEQEFSGKAERFNAAYKEAVKMRNRNLYNSNCNSQKLDSDIDRLVIVSDGQTSARSLADDAQFHGTDTVSIAFNDLVDTESATSRSQAPADD